MAKDGEIKPLHGPCSQPRKQQNSLSYKPQPPKRAVLPFPGQQQLPCMQKHGCTCPAPAPTSPWAVLSPTVELFKGVTHLAGAQLRGRHGLLPTTLCWGGTRIWPSGTWETSGTPHCRFVPCSVTLEDFGAAERLQPGHPGASLLQSSEIEFPSFTHSHLTS